MDIAVLEIENTHTLHDFIEHHPHELLTVNPLTGETRTDEGVSVPFDVSPISCGESEFPECALVLPSVADECYTLMCDEETTIYLTLFCECLGHLCGQITLANSDGTLKNFPC